jgi:hypothetical protein
VETLPAGTPLNVSDDATNHYYRATSAHATGWLPAAAIGLGEVPAGQTRESTNETHRSLRSTWDVSLVGTFQLTSLSSNYGPNNDSSGGFTNGGLTSASTFGAGFLVSDKIMPTLSIEAGLLWQPRSYNQTLTSSTGNLSFGDTYNYVQIPVVVRYHFLNWLSAGLGLYYARIVGDIRFTETSTVPNLTFPSGTQTSSYGPYGISLSDYGVIGAVGVKIPLGDSPLSIDGDMRYELGLNNINNGSLTTLNSANAPDSNKWRMFQLLLGLTFVFQ